MTSLRLLESTVEELVHVSYDFTAAISSDDFEGLQCLPVFVPHSIYKAAFVLMHELQYTKKLDVGHAISSLKSLLKYMGTRWLAGSMDLGLAKKNSCINRWLTKN